MGIMRGRHGARIGWRAGESSRCEDPAPTVGVCGDAIASQMPPIVTTMRMPMPLRSSRYGIA